MLNTPIHKIFIRTDASRQLGMGHIYRCLALWEEMKDHDATIFVRKDYPVSADLYKQRGATYETVEDADDFIKLTHTCVPSPRTLAQRLRFLFVGPRHHQWMYDGKSLSKLLEKHGFVQARAVPPGETRITDYGELNLQERHEASVYVEAEKPDTEVI